MRFLSIKRFFKDSACLLRIKKINHLRYDKNIGGFYKQSAIGVGLGLDLAANNLLILTSFA